MSHFFVTVLVPGDTPPDQIEAVCTELFAPYSEHLDVPEYDRECYCVGGIARRASFEATARHFAETHGVEGYAHHRDVFDRVFRDTYREKVAAEIPADLKREGIDWKNREQVKAYDEAEKKAEEKVGSWQDHIAPWQEMEDTLEKAHAMYGKPDPACDECGGGGTNKSTYNPKSKWDWYSFGGRYNGCIHGEYKGDETGFNFPDEYRQLEKNVTTVKALLKRGKEKGVDDITSFAILTPDGEWFEKGEMGWWAMVANEKDQDEFKGGFMNLLEKHIDCLAVGVDCHI